MDLKKIITYSTLFLLAFFYSFGIEPFNDIDMHRYFVNGFYMTNYGMEGIKGYPNQLFSLFLYWGYKITGNWYGLSNILFLPLYLFGLYSLYMVLNYFIKKDYVALLFTLIFLLVGRSSEFALSFSTYIVYFFFFISIIYLALYHSKKLYLIGFYFAVATLFRNQLIVILPFVPFIINPKINRADYLKTIIPFLVALIVVQIEYEVVKNIAIPQKSAGVNFSYYFTELDKFLLANKYSMFSAKGIVMFLSNNLSHYYFYLVLAPCFFMFNKKFAISTDNTPKSKGKNKAIVSPSSPKSLLTIFLILALFIYFMPAIMYVRLGLTRSAGEYYSTLSRYSFIMIALLIPVYHFIIKEQTFIKINHNVVYLVMVAILLPVLSLNKAPIFVKNTFTNISHKKELYGIDSTKIETVLKANFNENAFFISNNWATQIYVGSKARFRPNYSMKNQNITHRSFNYSYIDGVILIGESYPYLVAGKTIYTKIYEEKSDNPISIYKKAN